MQKRFITYGLLFFTPIILGYIGIEYATRSLPSSYKVTQKYIEQHRTAFENLILGSSQLKHAVNPAWIDTPTLNLASGNQHHDTDFKIIKQLLPELPQLKTMVLEVSYSHFELPHNGPNFWKNTLYLHYYNINTFHRGVYFKDRLVYLSNPPFFSNKLEEYYLKKEYHPQFNTYGFQIDNYDGPFKDATYNEIKISALDRFKINTTPNASIFETNTTLFFDLLAYAASHDLSVVICEAPMYKTYLNKRDASILYRRDSILKVVKERYPDVQFLALETDTINFGVRDYWNQSHLNPDGAKKFTKKLNALLSE